MAKKKFGRFWKVLKIFFAAFFIVAITLVVLFYYRTDVTKNIDNYGYGLPFKKGTSHRVVQGYGGLFSHKHIAAIDFEMPVGTTVCAARNGTVYSYKEDSDQGGVFSGSKANYIMIKHDDGSFGCYWHLKKNGVLVKNGYVFAGQEIGLSGATGNVLRPHLHFSVKRVLNYQMDSFLKTKFRTTDGLMFLETGSSYQRPD